jgi:DNA polymerase (family 10)
MANGLNEDRALRHAAHVRSLDGHAGVRLLAGIECDIRADGSLDLADECLAALDLVVISVHSGFNQEPSQMTERLLRALDNRYVDILGHPTGRLLLKREPYAYDLDAILEAAARRGVAVEINCQTNRLDLSDVHARLAVRRGVKLVISSDAHSRHAFPRLRWGIGVARRAWLTKDDVINTGTLETLKAGLRRHRP